MHYEHGQGICVHGAVLEDNNNVQLCVEHWQELPQQVTRLKTKDTFIRKWLEIGMAQEEAWCWLNSEGGWHYMLGSRVRTRRSIEI